MTKYWRNPPQPLAPDLANIEGAHITDTRQDGCIPPDPAKPYEWQRDGDYNPQPKRTRRRKSRKAV